MAKFKNKVELRLVRSLSDFKAMRREAKFKRDQLALDELCRRQAELLEWAMDNMPDGKPGQNDDADSF